MTLAASGWTWAETFVLYDKETGSLWFGGEGPVGRSKLTCVAGPLEGASLDRIEHSRVIWRSWYALYPFTKLARER